MVISFVDKVLIMFANVIRNLHNGKLIIENEKGFFLLTPFRNFPYFQRKLLSRSNGFPIDIKWYLNVGV